MITVRWECDTVQGDKHLPCKQDMFAYLMSNYRRVQHTAQQHPEEPVPSQQAERVRLALTAQILGRRREMRLRLRPRCATPSNFWLRSIWGRIGGKSSKIVMWVR